MPVCCFFIVHGLISLILAFQLALSTQTILIFSAILLAHHLLLMLACSLLASGLFVHTHNKQALDRINHAAWHHPRIRLHQSADNYLFDTTPQGIHRVLGILIAYTVSVAFISDFSRWQGISRKMKQCN